MIKILLLEPERGAMKTPPRHFYYNKNIPWVGKGYFYYTSKRPPCGGLFMERLFGYAALELVEFDDKTILWEGNAGANILGINHTDIELIAVVWLDI